MNIFLQARKRNTTRAGAFVKLVVSFCVLFCSDEYTVQQFHTFPLASAQQPNIKSKSACCTCTLILDLSWPILLYSTILVQRLSSFTLVRFVVIVVFVPWLYWERKGFFFLLVPFFWCTIYQNPLSPTTTPAPGIILLSNKLFLLHYSASDFFSFVFTILRF